MSKTTSNILKVFVGLVLLITLFLGVYYWVSFKSKNNEIADIINRGNAFMEAAYYDEAIKCYEKAIEYEDSEDAPLISAIIEAYMRKGASEGETDSAIVDYYSAIAMYPDNKKAYWAIADIYEHRGDEDSMINVLRQGYNDTDDETMKSKVVSAEQERARVQAEIAEREAAEREEAERKAELVMKGEQLVALIPLFEENDYDGLKDIMRSPEFISYSDEVIGDISYYNGALDENGNREGVGIALYENGYYYYGDFHNDVRSGHGIIMRAAYAESSSIGSFYYEGEWAEDKPNGEGVATSNYYRDRISANDFLTKTITGNYTNGLENGNMVLTGTTKSGVSRTFKYNTTDGVAEKSSSKDSGVEGQYVIAESGDENLTSDGSVRGIEGFVEENL